MSISTGQKGKIFSDINITPLTDIFLVLLVIMMILAPMFNDINDQIEKPDIQTGDTVNKDIINVEITRDGSYFVTGKPIAAGELVTVLNQYHQESKSTKAVVTADKNTPSKYILSIIRSAQEAGLEKLIVAGSPLSTSRATELEGQSSQEDSF